MLVPVVLGVDVPEEAPVPDDVAVAAPVPDDVAVAALVLDTEMDTVAAEVPD